MVETRWKGATAEGQTNICYSKALHYIESKSNEASIELEQDPFLILVPACNSSFISGMQQATYLNKVDVSATHFF